MSIGAEAGRRTRLLAQSSAYFPIACGILIALSGAFTALTIYTIYERFWVDLEAYRAGGAAALQHTSIYDLIINDRGLFTYAPFAAILFTPFALLSMKVSVALWTLISILALEAVIWILIGHTTGKRHPGRRATQTILATIIILPLFPVTITLWNGQIGIILLLLIIADLTHGKEKWRGIGTGIAAGIKLTPLIFIPYLLLTRRFRAALVTTGGFLGTVALGFVLLPNDSRDYWSSAFIDSQRVAPLPDMHILNHSIRGMLILLPGGDATPVWLVLAATIGAGGLVVAARAARKLGDLAGITACAIVGLLVSPVSWSHHWVWCIPLLALWARRAWRTNAPLEKAGVGFLWLIFLLPGYLVLLTVLRYPARAGAWLPLLTDSYVLTGLAVLITLGVYLWRHRATG